MDGEESTGSGRGADFLSIAPDPKVRVLSPLAHSPRRLCLLAAIDRRIRRRRGVGCVGLRPGKPLVGCSGHGDSDAQVSSLPPWRRRRGLFSPPPSQFPGESPKTRLGLGGGGALCVMTSMEAPSGEVLVLWVSGDWLVLGGCRVQAVANQWRFIGPASPPLIFGVFFGGKERGCVPAV